MDGYDNLYSTFLLVYDFRRFPKFDPNLGVDDDSPDKCSTNPNNVSRTESRTTKRPIEEGAKREENEKRKKRQRERERKKTVSSSTTTRRKKCTWTMVRRREQEEEGREKRVSVNRERTLPRYRGLDSKFKSYYPVDAIRRGLELGWRGWGRRRGGWCKYMTQRHGTSLKIEISK